MKIRRMRETSYIIIVQQVVESRNHASRLSSSHSSSSCACRHILQRSLIGGGALPRSIEECTFLAPRFVITIIACNWVEARQAHDIMAPSESKQIIKCLRATFPTFKSKYVFDSIYNITKKCKTFTLSTTLYASRICQWLERRSKHMYSPIVRQNKTKKY